MRRYGSLLELIFLPVCMALICAGTAGAQSGYPNKPIRLIIGFSPGAAVDTVSRTLGAGLAALGQPVIMENKPGAAGIVGNEFVARAAPDGYTLLAGTTAPFSIVPNLTAKLPYDPVKDYAAVAPFARSASILVVNASLPVNSVKEFIAYARERPGQLNYASNGNGGILHMGMEMFSTMAGIRMVHVPYNNLMTGLGHVASGELQVMFISPTNAMPLVQGGRLRALGIATLHRSEMVPNIPTLDEEGLKGFNFSVWYGLFAPAGTPRAVVNILNAAVNSAMQQPDIADRLRKSAAERFPGTAEDLAALVRTELDMYAKVARDTGLQKQ
jgi:tripartite-type tricarboxylate transporter receptor subunit TctC